MKCFSPGKIILAGEHAVVHGHPAIVSSISLKTKMSITPSNKQLFEINLKDLNMSIIADSHEKLLDKTKSLFPIYNKILELIPVDTTKMKNGFSLEVSSEIPRSAGLGSSATICACLVNMLARYHGVHLTKEELLEKSKDAEKLFHSNPSGIDTTATIQGGAFLFEQGTIKEVINDGIHLNGHLIIVNTNISRNTKELVQSVGNLLKERPRFVQERFDKISKVVMDIWNMIKSRKMDIEFFGKKMLENQGYLRDIGVSNSFIDNLIERCLKIGATGGKITGAGGGGCLIIACNEGKQETIMQELSKEGLPAFEVKMAVNGIEIKE
ncbi:MAG: mevalonate kinase [Promethearchaeota archaeon]